MIRSRMLIALAFVLSVLLVNSVSYATDIRGDTKDSWGPSRAVTTPGWEYDIDNGDGTYTFVQGINAQSTPPHYYGPFYNPEWCCDSIGGFNFYSWFDLDFGWQHNFPHWADPNLAIYSATLTVKAWDVDSEATWGLDGEFDGIHVNGTLLDPGYLQGLDDQWTTTMFDIPISEILGSGLLNVFLDIDMHHQLCYWATTVEYSELRIMYSWGHGVPNNPPYRPLLELLPGPPSCPFDTDNLVVHVVGPNPRDPDGDAVTYRYRWFVDVGTGGFVDDEYAGRGDHTGNTVPAADTQTGDIWRVQVTPVDEHQAIGNYATATFSQVGGPTTVVPTTWGKIKASYR
ncbi:MAG: hypothetical protein QME66_07010 [Candidatus Eisenbacteria bacterium]|nr:hypothetical protein [Candidatus Eisenbacteria bacterium]